MDNQTKLAFRILATLCPDCKPSEVRKIIDEVLSKEANQDDIDLWMALTKDHPEEKKEPEKKIIEEHHYHHYDYWHGPYYTLTSSPSIINKDYLTITCDNTDTITGTQSNTVDYNSITISSDALMM